MNKIWDMYDLNISYLMRMAEKAWNSVCTIAISRTWIRSRFLPTVLSAENQVIFKMVRNGESQDDDSREVQNLLSRTSFIDVERK